MMKRKQAKEVQRQSLDGGRQFIREIESTQKRVEAAIAQEQGLSSHHPSVTSPTDYVQSLPSGHNSDRAEQINEVNLRRVKTAEGAARRRYK